MHLFYFITFMLLTAGVVQGADTYREVRVTDPFLELHTGPGRGYPIDHVVERNTTIQILKRKTEWFKVRTAEQREGWVHREQMLLTLTASGEQTQFNEVTLGDFSRRRGEAGVMGGKFASTDVLSLHVAYAFSANVSAELSFSQVLGNFSSSTLVSGNLTHQSFPDWYVSPFFSMGMGRISTSTRATLIQVDDRDDLLAHAGLGLRTYITRNYVLRAEYNKYVVFSSDDDNEDINEWKVGLLFFF